MSPAQAPDYRSVATALQPGRKAFALSLVGLALFLAWQALVLQRYSKSLSRPPSWDQSVHLQIALDYRQALKSGNWRDAWDLAPKPGLPFLPPLYHLALMGSYDSPNPAAAALGINWFYMALLCVSLFALIYEFCPDSTALGGTIVFACSPAVQQLMLTQLIELPVLALSAAAFWALVRSEGFSRWGPSIAFSLLFAAGMMHHWTFFSYMLPAFYWALRGLGRLESRFKVLAAALVALAGFGPWYLRHLPALSARLFQASAQAAAPGWKTGGFFNCLLVSADGLGPFFWALAWLSLLVPQYRRNALKGWVIPAWVLSSYVFWAIAPNSQLRFLLPGLPGLAVAVCGAAPSLLVWTLAAYQLFGAANYSAGWISPVSVPFPFTDLTFLPADPPSQDDWKIADILREADKRRGPDSPVESLTLVANAPYFNASNFNWTAGLLNIPGVRVRGAGKRLCEFSEFVVLKSGGLGPPGAVEGLPEAAKIIEDKEQWFSKAYEEARRWPLPDKTAAILYQRRRAMARPFPDRLILFQYYNSDALVATGLKLELARWDSRASVYPWAKASASQAELRGFKLSDLAVEFEKVALVSAVQGEGPQTWDDVRFIRLSKLRIKTAKAAAADLKALAERRVKGLQIDRLELDNTVRFAGRLRHIAVAGEASASLQNSPRALRLDLLRFKIGGTPVPPALLKAVKALTIPLYPTPETPFAIDLPGLTLKGGFLTIP